MRSRSSTLSNTSSNVTSFPWAFSSLRRRYARVSGSAVMKTLSSALGNTTVPMSRPSITTPPASAMRCWMATSLVRTSGTRATRLTLEATSMVRISFSTLMPFK